MEHIETTPQDSINNQLNQLVDTVKSKFGELSNRIDDLALAHKRPRFDTSHGKGNSETSSLFVKGVINGDEQSAREYKALSVGSDPDGGYTVTPSMENTIYTVARDFSPLRQLANRVDINTSSLEVLVSGDQPAANWVGETDSRNETTSPNIRKITIPVHELHAAPRATQKFLDDSGINAEEWLAQELADKFAQTEGDALINGDGVGKPRGILTYDAGTGSGQIEQVNSGANGGVTYAGLVNTVYALKAGYRQNAVWMMTRELIGKVMSLSGNDTPLWIPSIAVGQPPTLLGYPVYECDFLPAASAGSLSGAFGNFRRGYTIADRQGISTIRDPYTAKPYVVFDTTKRVGGAVVDGAAIKLLKLSA